MIFTWTRSVRFEDDEFFRIFARIEFQETKVPIGLIVGAADEGFVAGTITAAS
jgi:hypothetical protein